MLENLQLEEVQNVINLKSKSLIKNKIVCYRLTWTFSTLLCFGSITIESILKSREGEHYEMWLNPVALSKQHNQTPSIVLPLHQQV